MGGYTAKSFTTTRAVRNWRYKSTTATNPARGSRVTSIISDHLTVRVRVRALYGQAIRYIIYIYVTIIRRCRGEIARAHARSKGEKFACKKKSTYTI